MLNAAVSLTPPDEYQKPRFALPRGACDSHTHVIPESGWNLVAEATYKPAPAPAATHLRMLDALGIDRGGNRKSAPPYSAWAMPGPMRSSSGLVAK